MRTNGQIGYDAYRAKTGGVSLATGQPIPEWKELRPEIQEAWEAAGEAIATPQVYDKTPQQWAAYIMDWCERKGWNQNLDFPKMLMNLHSEITEAWEEVRNNRGIDEVYEGPNGKPEGVPIEITDLLIRLLHICAWRGWNIEELLERKMAYNEKRPYRHGGKAA